MIDKKQLLTSLFACLLLGLTGCNNDGDDGAAGAAGEPGESGQQGEPGEQGPAGVSNTLIELSALGSYTPPGVDFDEAAAEIVAYDSQFQRLFVVNAQDLTVDVLDIGDPAQPILLGTIDASAEGGAANSVAVHGDLVAVAIEAEVKTDPGKVVFYNASDLNKLDEIATGALPDMLTFTRDGNRLLVANEGEPNDDYDLDPEGSVTVIDLSNGLASASANTADFTGFNGQEADLRSRGVRIFGPGASAAQDFEPEYIAVSPDNSTAWVSLQEANAVAVVDIEAAEVTEVIALGYKDHSIIGNELDASNRDLNSVDNDERINIRNWPVFGMYQPDAMVAYDYNGKAYYITANEGDSRDYDGFSEEYRIKDLPLAAGAFPNDIQNDENLGRLNVTSTMGVSNGCDPSDPATDPEVDCEYDALYAYGARSFSIWSADGTQVFDSGSEFERIIASRYPDNFNSNNDENSFDNRSDDKGPEPEAVEVATVNGSTFAFIGLERVGGIMVYEVSNPQSPEFVQYINNRDFSVTDAELETGMGGDLGPESIVFISAAESPVDNPLLAVGNEVSGTTTLYQIDVIELSAE